jgi:osmoprotectant transport system substrate-binding protein
MRLVHRKAAGALVRPAAAVVLAAGLSACGTSSHDASSPPPPAPSSTSKVAATTPGATSTTDASTTSASSTSTRTTALPGSGKPQVTIGDKNYTEQFVLGELYRQALEAEGYSVVLNRNIGPTEVTIPALESGRLDMYPEYIGTWDSQIAGYPHSFRTILDAYRAGQRYALGHGLELLNATPFSDTAAIAVTRAYAAANDLSSLIDLRRVATSLTVGAPPQFQQSDTGLPAIEQAYGFYPASFKSLNVGGQYQALDHGTVQAAAVATTDGQLASGRYKLLRDPRRVFGWGNVVPVVSAKILTTEGPEFTATIDRVSALLTTPVMRRLNAAVDVAGQDPAAVAKQFLQDHGLLTPTTP